MDQVVVSHLFQQHSLEELLGHLTSKLCTCKLCLLWSFWHGEEKMESLPQVLHVSPDIERP